MTAIKENVELGPLTTLRIGGVAKYYVEVGTSEELREALEWAHEKDVPIFVLSGGSNILVSDKGFPGLVINPRFLGIEVVDEDTATMLVRVGSGENLDKFIGWSVNHGLWGLENLSFVPGNVGATPVFNVGCYGAQVSDTIERVEAVDIKTGAVRNLNKDKCAFEYRKSIFNTIDEGKYIITAAYFRLSKEGTANLTYIDTKRFFENMRVRSPSLAQMRYAITSIRGRKGQDTNEFWSAGSFFKNLRLQSDEYKILKKNIVRNFGERAGGQIENLKNRFMEPTSIKIPTGYILDKLLRLHGARVGGAQLNRKQIIMIVNSGGATAEHVMKLFQRVRQITYYKTGAKLQNEPTLVGFTPEEIKDYFSLD